MNMTHVMVPAGVTKMGVFCMPAFVTNERSGARLRFRRGSARRMGSAGRARPNSTTVVRGVVVLVLLIAAVCRSVDPAQATTVAAQPADSVWADFDGDGFVDLAVGVPDESVAGSDGAGMVNVLYGGSGGLTSRDQVWHQDSAGVKGVAEPGDRFGASVAAGDFDGDGRADLAVGVPEESVAGSDGAGMVNVLYGGSGGLTSRDQVWHQDSVGILGGVEAFDFFGHAVAAGDFDGDGRADLAVGVPQESIGAVEFAGMVNVLYGGSGGLTSRDQVWHQDSPGIQDAAETEDEFGWSLADGDFDGDGRADLAIGVPFESVSVSGVGVGSVDVLYGGPGGLTSRDQVWHQDSPGIKGVAEFPDLFGWSVAAGDFDGDGRADLAVGVPNESLSGVERAGMVNVLYGGSGGLTSRDQVWHQGSAGILGGVEAGDRFGESVAAGDFDGDGRADLAAGVPAESVGGSNSAGMVNVLYGGSGGLTSRDQVWHQDSAGVKGVAEPGDRFGESVGAG
ncbi:MAG TPA: FG-GAP repeat protein [Euzebyales bacterium]|nr:FG-GAP repeat protein [Euzebyales bacterium]